MIAYWFFADKLRDGRPIPPDGEWLKHDAPWSIVPCVRGLHASECPFDALQYAPGPNLALVKLDGVIVPHGNPIDKYCASARKIIARVDATDMLRQFARNCALSVIDTWDAPAVVREYLETGGESLRAAARAAAWAAASDAARAAARAAARDAARNAQRESFRALVHLTFRLGGIP